MSERAFDAEAMADVSGQPLPPEPVDLSAKEAAFAVEYLKDMNATAAARRAGYSARSAKQLGSRLLHRPAVAARIAQLQGERRTAVKIDSERVLIELARVGMSNLRDFCTWGPDGVKLKAADELPPELAACVAEVTETSGKNGKQIRFKLHDKARALEMLARHLGLFGDEKPATSALEQALLAVADRLLGRVIDADYHPVVPLPTGRLPMPTSTVSRDTAPADDPTAPPPPEAA